MVEPLIRMLHKETKLGLQMGMLNQLLANFNIKLLQLYGCGITLPSGRSKMTAFVCYKMTNGLNACPLSIFNASVPLNRSSKLTRSLRASAFDHLATVL